MKQSEEAHGREDKASLEDSALVESVDGAERGNKASRVTQV